MQKIFQQRPAKGNVRSTVFRQLPVAPANLLPGLDALIETQAHSQDRLKELASETRLQVLTLGQTCRDQSVGTSLEGCGYHQLKSLGHFDKILIHDFRPGQNPLSR